MSDWNALQTITNVTLTYLSSDSPVFVASTSSDLTGVVSVGMRLRISQVTGGTKYFIVVAITTTTVTLYGGTDYTLVNETISSPVFSSAKVPIGFPMDPTKWQLRTTNTSTNSQPTPTANTWYNIGSLNIVIPIGAWDVDYHLSMGVDKVSATHVDCYSTLSTSSSGESDTDFTAENEMSVPSSTIYLESEATKRKYLVLASKTTYYLNGKTRVTGGSTIYFDGTHTSIVITARCAYL